MIKNTHFTVLMEKSPLYSLRRLTLALVTSAAALLALNLNTAHGATDRPLSKRPMHAKLADDLSQGIDATTAPRKRWLREHQGRRMVQVIITSDSSDPKLAELRQAIERAGGTVLVRLPLINGMTAIVPARQMRELAKHDDVVHIAPNRDTASTVNDLEWMSGLYDPNIRWNSTRTGYTGLDGSGVGIAILDSGVQRQHKVFLNASGASRVLRSVSMLNTTVSTWATSGDRKSVV